jgi:hypothetical protein
MRLACDGSSNGYALARVQPVERHGRLVGRAGSCGQCQRVGTDELLGRAYQWIGAVYSGQPGEYRPAPEVGDGIEDLQPARRVGGFLHGGQGVP